MMNLLSRLGVDRTFELIEFLILFFVLTSVATLLAVLAYSLRSRRVARASDKRLEAILQHLGRDLFGEDAWAAVEKTLVGDPRRMDTFLSVLDQESFDVWASNAEQSGLVPSSEIQLLRSRLTRPGEARRQVAAPARVSESNPTFGMPVAVQQGGFQARGTIADVEKETFTLWVLGEEDQFDDSTEASFVLLSRSGTYQFDSRFRKLPDGTLVVDRPARSLRSQRRRFDRHAARLPVNVARINDDSQRTDATITELGGGGATVTDPERVFEEGQVLKLSFEAGGNNFTVAGRVIRADDGALHVRFEAMRDQERLEIAESVTVLEPSRGGNGSKQQHA